jgi:hypothetical protein
MGSMLGFATAPKILLQTSAVIAMAAALNGCGTRLEEPEPSNRVAAAAWREWRLFGGGSITYASESNGGRPMRKGIDETDEPAASRIGEYWQLIGRPEWSGRDTDRPWSGAFISFVMARAGVPANDFPRVGRHALFLLAIEDNTHRDRRPAFALRDPDTYTLKPGDLLCRGSGGNVMRADWLSRREAIDRFVEHCDVVIAVRRPYLRVIGGNTRDSVMLTSLPMDSRDRPLPVAGRSWMVAVENRSY